MAESLETVERVDRARRRCQMAALDAASPTERKLSGGWHLDGRATEARLEYENELRDAAPEILSAARRSVELAAELAVRDKRIAELESLLHEALRDDSISWASRAAAALEKP